MAIFKSLRKTSAGKTAGVPDRRGGGFQRTPAKPDGLKKPTGVAKKGGDREGPELSKPRRADKPMWMHIYDD